MVRTRIVNLRQEQNSDHLRRDSLVIQPGTITYSKHSLVKHDQGEKAFIDQFMGYKNFEL